MSDLVSNARTLNYLKQIKGAILYKSGAIAASFLAMPLMIAYLGSEQFGVWSTLLTIMSWVVFFDLGIGNGLKNKIAECLAKDESLVAGKYISSAYSLVGLILLVIWSAFLGASFIIPWQRVFNTLTISDVDLRTAVQVAISFVILNFLFGLVTAVIGAMQKSSLISLGQLMTNLVALAFVFFLNKFTEASIVNLALVYGIALVFPNVVLSFWIYKFYPHLRPRIEFNSSHFSPLISVGSKFFAIQLAVLVVFATDKVLIAQMFGPHSVTEYELIFKVFSVITFAHALISTPLWSAYTDAYHREDISWIRNMLGKQLTLFVGVVLGILILCGLVEWIIAIWIPIPIEISKSLVVAVAVFFIVSVWNNIFAMILNGIGKTSGQLYTALAAMLLNIPLAIFFVKVIGMGPSGVIFAAAISLSFSAIFLPIQVFRLVGLKVWRFN